MPAPTPKFDVIERAMQRDIGGAAAHRQRATPRHGVDVRGADTCVVGQLEAMASSLDNAEWRMLVYALFAAIGLSVCVSCCIVIYFVPRVDAIIYRFAWGSGLLLVVTLIFIFEPRPQHWFPSLEGALKTFSSGSGSEWKHKIRNWWKWRTRHHARTRSLLPV